MTECFYNKFHPTLPQCKNEGRLLVECLKTGNGTDHWTWCEQHMKRIDAAGDQLVAVQPERCCLDYPRCDCNSPPEPDNAPTVQPCGHPWKAQQDRSQMLMAELTPDATKAMNMRANGERPWSFHDSFDVCRNDRLLLLQHSDALSARLAEAEALLRDIDDDLEMGAHPHLHRERIRAFLAYA